MSLHVSKVAKHLYNEVTDWLSFLSARAMTSRSLGHYKTAYVCVCPTPILFESMANPDVLFLYRSDQSKESYQHRHEQTCEKLDISPVNSNRWHGNLSDWLRFLDPGCLRLLDLDCDEVCLERLL